MHLGRCAYEPAAIEQQRHHARVLAARERGEPLLGVVLAVEHDPVITVSNRPGAAEHLLATPEQLAALGVDVRPTDRGGDITYHGPGQLVVYPLLDLKRLRLRVHEHLRRMEQAVIDAIAPLGLAGRRDPDATGVWLPQPGGPDAKVCAMGVRVRRWVTLHGLALNVDPDLTHFDLIVPCGLAGRPVTSLRRELGTATPPLGAVRDALIARYVDLLSVDQPPPSPPPAGSISS